MFKLNKAIYTPADEEGEFDITNLLIGRYLNGDKEFWATNDWIGEDPFPGLAKQVIVEVTLPDGGNTSYEYGEDAQIDIFADTECDSMTWGF